MEKYRCKVNRIESFKVNCQIVSYELLNGVVYFVIEIKIKDKNHNNSNGIITKKNSNSTNKTLTEKLIKKRYSQFLELKSKLKWSDVKDENNNSIIFPSKKYCGSYSTGTSQQRMEQLNYFLHSLTNDRKWYYTKAFLEFIKYQW